MAGSLEPVVFCGGLFLTAALVLISITGSAAFHCYCYD